MGMELLRAPKMKAGDESVADFVREHYGQEAVDYLAEPLLSGIYGGDPRELSVTAVLPRFVELATKYGSLTRGVLASRAQARNRTAPGAVVPHPEGRAGTNGGCGEASIRGQGHGAPGARGDGGADGRGIPRARGRRVAGGRSTGGGVRGA